jgi:hypothetical protein
MGSRILLVSDFWSDFTRNQFYGVSFYDDDKAPFRRDSQILCHYTKTTFFLLIYDIFIFSASSSYCESGLASSACYPTH